ncbi:lipoprotein [Noviherbaspirillum aridicola]|uniref:Lipoprotein n=2 Tax=Noviherbaspirillum aridicola TaxID=2849687 RepID=A0ABQ4Q0Y9_9BURK|nr:lipoprotein [Noviherbaspirillum aridicola]
MTPSKPVRCLASLLLAASSLLLVACDRQGEGGQMLLSPVGSGFKNTDVTGLDYAKGFAMKDHNGQPRKLEDFRGKAVVVFFGYTHCPDVCPTTMAEMANVMQQLGPQAERVQVLFVTVDPERDTPQLLSQYVPAFHPSFLGLIGDKAETEKIAKDFRVFYQKVNGKDGGYTMDHTAGSYVFDPQGRIRLFVRHGQGTEPIVHDLKLLLSEAGGK